MNKKDVKNLLWLLMVTRTKTLSDVLGMAPQTFSTKLNERNGAEFNQTEIKIINERYRLLPEQLTAIFFAK